MRSLALFKDHPFKYANNIFFRAICMHVVDGDTYDFLIDLGFYNYVYKTIRLKGVDTPEIFSGINKEAGQSAKKFVTELILNKSCLLQTHKDPESFGRFIADVFYMDDNEEWISLAFTLVKEGYSI